MRPAAFQPGEVRKSDALLANCNVEETPFDQAGDLRISATAGGAIELI